MDHSSILLKEEEQYAKDLQMALNLHRKEEEKQARRKRREMTKRHHDFDVGDGYSRGALRADHMLFISCTIDHNEVAMLIDTGASTSTLSMQMVHLLGLESKMNSMVSGNAQGIGSSDILGIVENVAVKVGGLVEFRSLFMVLEGSMPFIILGLDQMRRFNCVIDIGNNSLIFQGRDGLSIPFLPQKDAEDIAQNMLQINGL